MERPEYTDEQKERVILDFFGPSGTREQPLCPVCGDLLEFRSTVTKITGLQMDVECTGCGRQFVWSQPQPAREWKVLHLKYFFECYQSGQPPRCPYDDCYVSHAEFEDGVVQFNCPVCNRRGRVEARRGE